MTASSHPETLHSFRYMATLKVDEPSPSLAGLYPGVNSIACSSRTFGSYDECITSCRQLMDDFLKQAGAANLKLGSEVNPIHSGQVTLSKDWALGEVSRIWIYDKRMEGTGHIHAVGQARIFAQTGSIDLPRHN